MNHNQQHPQLQLQKQQQQQLTPMGGGGGGPRRVSTASSGRESNKAGSDAAKDHAAAALEGRWNGQTPGGGAMRQKKIIKIA